MLQGVLVALAATLIYLESRIGGQHMIDRPIIIGPVVGLIMGDPVTGLVVGGQLELVWMGLAGIGTTTPPDVVTGSALGTALAIQTGASYETTLALAIPISPVGPVRRHRRADRQRDLRASRRRLRRQPRLQGRRALPVDGHVRLFCHVLLHDPRWFSGWI